MPLKWEQYNDLKAKYGNLDDLFFEYGKLYWFRYNFCDKLGRFSLSTNGAEEDSERTKSFRKEILELFHKQGHYRMVDENISKTHMHEFIMEFGIALSYVEVQNVTYMNTDADNIKDELAKIYLRDLLSLYVCEYQKCTIREQILGLDNNEKISKLKNDLLTTLYGGFESRIVSIGAREELEEFDLKEILLFLDGICS